MSHIEAAGGTALAMDVSKVLRLSIVDFVGARTHLG
jgi:hypothetical protein